MTRRKGKTTKGLKHPMQPIGWDDTRQVIRFKQNAIVRWLLDTNKNPMALNEIARMPFKQEDRVQLAQLIGYSTSGFGDLSYVPKRIVAECDEIARKLYEGE
jgi:hypothetical protein